MTVLTDTEPITAEARAAVDALLAEPGGWVVVVASGLATSFEQPTFAVKVYGPFATRDLAETAAFGTLRRLEGGAIMVRPLVSLTETLDSVSGGS